MALARFHQSGESKYKPSVEKNSLLIKYPINVFDQNSFSKNWQDLLNGNPGLVTIKSLPIENNFLYLNENPLQINDTFFSVNAQNLEFRVPSNYVIHNGVLYRFENELDTIIQTQNDLGYKMIANYNGLLVFVDPNNTADMITIQGIGIRNSDLEFKFSVRSTVSQLETATQIFCPIPWENVNVKKNFVLQPNGGDGTPIDNPLNYFDVSPSVDVNGKRIITLTLRLVNGQEFQQSYEDQRGDSTSITVTDLNNRANRNEIGQINLKKFFETITDLTKIEHVAGTKKVRWFYRNETGVEYYREFDFTPLIPAAVLDINIDKIEPDPDDADVWVVYETDGTPHEINLSKYVASVSVDPETGAITISQGGNQLFTVGLAGQTNNYYDLDQLPVIPSPFGLPKGLKDQIYFISEEGTNKVIPDWLLLENIIVQSQEEFDIATAEGFTLEKVFDTWEMFSHYNGEHGANGGTGAKSPPNFPALNPNDGPGVSLTAEEFYNKTAWNYNAADDSISLNRNYHCYTGYISPRPFGNYDFEAIMSSSNDDDDFIALIAAFYKDPETGYEYTLSLIRCMIENSGQGDWTYRIYYNFAQTNQKVIVEGTDLAPYPNGANGGWTTNGPSKGSINRTGNVFTFKTSQFGSTVIDEATEIIVDIDAMIVDFPELEPFKNFGQVGFAARSQQDAKFSNINFTGLTKYIFWPKEDFSYEVFEWNKDQALFILQDPQTIYAKDFFRNRFVYTDLFDKYYFVDQTDRIHCFKGDSGVSRQSFNALKLGWDKRPFLDSSLLGGSSGGSGLTKVYATISDMIADQNTQFDLDQFRVNDASSDPTVTAGRANYEYLGTTLGTIDDYYKYSEEESVDLDNDYEARISTLESSDYATTAEIATAKAEAITAAKNYTDIRQTTITTEVSITSETLSDGGYSQNGRNNVIKHSTNAINITLGATDNFIATYQKEGTGNITFVASAGKTIRQTNKVLDGALGSTAAVSVVGNVINVRISNDV